MQSDILEILQREQDHAVSLLSLSPSLATLLLSYSNRAETQDRRTFRETIVKLLEENQGLKSEVLEMVQRLKAAEASQKTVRSQVSSLREAGATLQDTVDSLREELVEVEDKYDRFIADSNVEKAALYVQVLDLEVHYLPCLILD